ncbi:DNA alkylation repair protein [Eubacteriales bacterium OttesenSCG-928-A19]|nr:DNA alkylation repair protein [Eubacteriales bacterium OttesenSCG-928-A19]
MADAIKNIYNHDSLRALAVDIQSAYSAFQVDGFLQSTMDETWDGLELKDRIIQISVNLGKYLPADYEEAIGIIDKVAMNYGTWLDGFVGFFPVFVEIYGQDEQNWDVSMAALARYTQYASSELAVRSFIIRHEDRMMAQMVAWSRDENEHVRRLASEGCRPALPWGQALNSFKKDPAPILPILEQLKADPSLHVRKSVANNLNDISKTHPDLVMRIARDWYGDNAHTDWVVKHGCRTLLKKGNRDALALFGYDDDTSIEVRDYALAKASIAIGEELSFSFEVLAKEAAKVRLEYGIDYVKSSGKRNRRVFKISEATLKQNEKKAYTKKHSFADVSVRKHYPGTHSITLIVNGTERGTLDFELKDHAPSSESKPR